ncbi:MAG: efflux RND transporter periplasmic adaptor subunit [Verrucomicrobia bacterium]|nr:MAG: efflux RND transporter periplasmic adaptor subunit [Verrucomicrobiota bacterium]
MTRSPLTLLALVLAISACHRSGPSAEKAADEVTPTATVKTVKLGKELIAATLTAYGTVVAQPSELVGVSVQYESTVMRLLVSAGESVQEGQPLIVVEPSPDTQLQLAQATSAAESAQRQLEQTARRFEMQLAINQDLQLARQTARDAAAKLSSLIARGAGERSTLKAELSGLLASVDVHIGQIVPAGAPLLALVPAHKIEVLLGVEPANAARLHAGQIVSLHAVNQDGVDGRGAIRLVTRRVNPQTRLVDTIVTVPPDLPLLLNGYVCGNIRVEEKDAFVVPREAILPDDDGPVLFTVCDGHAVKHQVTTGLETAVLTEVSGATLRGGDEVVTTGNYQLQDGMLVRRSE